MKNYLKLLVNIILPPRCPICGRVVSSEGSLCIECFEKIDFISNPYCECCGKPLYSSNIQSVYCLQCLQHKPPFRFCRSAIEYTTFSKQLILDFKFTDHLENKTLLAKWMFMAGQDIFRNGVDLIIPVPLYYTRLLKRTYNQSAVLCAELSKLSGIAADYTVLKKTKQTKLQTDCNAKQRKRNLKGAFSVIHPEHIKGKRVVLVDDVFTTGSTLTECAKTLKRSGAKSVDALTTARVCF